MVSRDIVGVWGHFPGVGHPRGDPLLRFKLEGQHPQETHTAPGSCGPSPCFRDPPPEAAEGAGTTWAAAPRSGGWRDPRRHPLKCLLRWQHWACCTHAAALAYCPFFCFGATCSSAQGYFWPYTWGVGRDLLCERQVPPCCALSPVLITVPSWGSYWVQYLEAVTVETTSWSAVSCESNLSTSRQLGP